LSVAVLEVDKLCKDFGGVRAVVDVSMTLEQGEIVGLIGPNGAGKTTVFGMLSGSLRPTSGTITLKGRQIQGWPAHRVCRAGLSRTFQVVRPFGSLSVFDNVLVGAKGGGAGERRSRLLGEEMLDVVGLSHLREEEAGSLSLINMKRLEIARALAARPSVLLLDEVFAGLTPMELPGAVALVRQIRDTGVTVMVIEHLMAIVMELSDRIVVLDHGEELAVGTPSEVVSNPRVIEAYLGVEYLDARD
jgi:branched-chain amino acid transport system ATP-binding protein